MIEVSMVFIINLTLAGGTIIFIAMGTWVWYSDRFRDMQIVAYLFASIFPIIGLFINGVIVIVD